MITLLLLVAAFFSGIIGFVYPPALFLTLGYLALVAVLWPLRRLHDRSEFISPWAFVIASVLIGIGVRGGYLALGLADQETLDRLFLLGKDVDFFLLPGCLVVVALLLMSLAYFSVPSRRVRRARLLSNLDDYIFHPKRIYVVVFLCVVMSFGAFMFFAQETGGLDLMEPSRKRAVSPGLEPDVDYRGLGYLRFLASFGAIAYLALLAYYATSVKTFSPVRLSILAVVFVVGCFLPFYASSRSDILWLILLSGVILIYADRRLRLVHLLAGVVVVLVIFQAMSFLRAERQFELAMTGYSGLSEAVDTLVLTRNLIDVTKTGHVIDAIPGTLEYRYGQTVLTWALAPIPREVWPGKPGIQPGTEVGVLIYGTRRAGVPPGFIAEMYWNFHIPGVILGCLLLGIALRVLHAKLNPRDSRNPALILLYAVVVMPLGMSILGGSLGQGMFAALLSATQALTLLWICRDRRHLGNRQVRQASMVPAPRHISNG